MRQPVNYDVRADSHVTPLPDIRSEPLARPHRPRPQLAADKPLLRSNSTTVRAILAAVLVVLLAMLAYLMSLSSRPSVTGLAPKPGSLSPPGIVTVQAHVGAAKPIRQVTLTIDGQIETPAVMTLGDRSWLVKFEGVLPRGSHHAVVDVLDVKGSRHTQSWSFESAGPSIAPTVAFTDPPQNTTLPGGMLWIHASVQSDADIASASMTVNGLEVPIVLKPNQSPATASTNAGSPAQTWSVGTEHAFAAGTYVAHITATDMQGDTSEANWKFTVSENTSSANARYFSSSKLYVAGQFLKFWEAHNGSLLLGEPVSPQFTDNRGVVVQYFTNARLEIGRTGTVVIGLLGSQALTTAQPKVAKPVGFGGLYFGETGHTLAGVFKDFWQQNGGTEIFGYPISEVLDQNGTKVQYFERARFELSTDKNGVTTVHLTPLGAQAWSTMHPAGAS